MGKQAGNHKKTQEEINRILLEKALEGKRVVRLKGGDPFLFGRGGEELELLRAHGVPFEIVPGVTSALAVPAYNGIPVTHREFASSVHIITGHRKAGEALDIDFQSLAKGGGTLVFLMGVRSLPEIVRGLLAAGMPADTPAAVLERGTSAGQRRVVAALGELEDEAGRQGIGTPAIIVVGEVCKLAETFGWYEQLPLFGEKILVTRPRDRASRLSEKLRELGAETVSLPSIETVPVSDDETKAKIGEAMELSLIHISEMSKVLRKLMPHTYFLVPGYGAQGGTAEDLRHCFNEDGLGAVVNSSRGIIAAYKQEKYREFGPERFGEASRQAVKDMVADINRVL